MTTTINLTVIFATLMTPILSGAMEIRQEEFRYAMNATRDIIGTTFVITDLPHRAGRLATVDCQPPPVNFQLGSAVLAPEEAENLMAGLRQCGLNNNIPLLVTGHTCTLGPEQINQDLALKRAKAVANLLLDSGFTVVETEGHGSRNPLTTDPQQLHLNRRVEITTVAPDNDIVPASQGR